MIIFLYGQDSYRITQKINEIISSYNAKNPSGLNLISFDFTTEDSLNNFFESVKSSSLIPEKKLIILKNIFSADSEAVLNFLKSQNLKKREDIIFVATSFGDSKGKLFEYLIKKPNQAQNFPPLKEFEIKNWARRFSNSLDIDLTGEALDFLIVNCGTDLWRLDCEIRKIASYKIKGVVNESQVEELIVPSMEYNIFELTDALAKKNKNRALRALYKALENNKQPIELLGLLAWQVRNILRFKLNSRPSNLKLHPFVLEKIKESSRFFSINELDAILSKIIDLDLAFKTTDLNEKMALSLLIAEL